MSEANVPERVEWFATDERTEAVRALEMSASLLQEVEKDPYMWKWAIVALHNAVQAFMVLALRGTWNVDVLPPDIRARKISAQYDRRQAVLEGNPAAVAAQDRLWGEESLAGFLDLYSRIKDEQGSMSHFVNSRAFVPRPEHDECIKALNDLRNDLLHFVPSSLNLLLTRFLALTTAALEVISFLVRESHTITWMPWEDREERANAALEAAIATTAHLEIAYKEYARPAGGCGAVPETG